MPNPSTSLRTGPLFYQPDLTLPYLTPEESHHALRVLRMRAGDTLEVTDGLGTLASAELTGAEGQNAGFRILKTQKIPRRSATIHLAIAPTKNIDRMEWMVEKVVEIGVEKVTFVKCAKSERPHVPMDRLNKLVISAMKQSRQAWLTQLNDMTTFMSFVSAVKDPQRFIAYVDGSNPEHLAQVIQPTGDRTLLIGPEGDFTQDELGLALQHGFRKVNLGPHRLRTETAGLYGVVILAAAAVAGREA